MSYGVKCCQVPWNAKDHDIRDKEWSNIDQGYKAVNQTSWFVRIVSYDTQVSRLT